MKRLIVRSNHGKITLTEENIMEMLDVLEIHPCDINKILQCYNNIECLMLKLLSTQLLLSETCLKIIDKVLTFDGFGRPCFNIDERELSSKVKVNAGRTWTIMSMENYLINTYLEKHVADIGIKPCCDWNYIFRNYEIFEDYVFSNIGKINFINIDKYYKFSHKFIIKNINVIGWKIGTYLLFNNRTISSSSTIIDKYSDYLDWDIISKGELSNDFVIKYNNKLNWEYVDIRRLSPDIIEEYSDKINWSKEENYLHVCNIIYPDLRGLLPDDVKQQYESQI